MISRYRKIQRSCARNIHSCFAVKKKKKKIIPTFCDLLSYFQIRKSPFTCLFSAKELNSRVERAS